MSYYSALNLTISNSLKVKVFEIVEDEKGHTILYSYLSRDSKEAERKSKIFTVSFVTSVNSKYREDRKD